MAVEKINPENVYTPYNNNYTQVTVGTGRRQVHVAGTVALSVEGQIVGEDDMAEQVRVIMAHIGNSLAAAGAGPQDVVRIETYVTDVERYLREGVRIVRDFFNDDMPASTLVEISRLVDRRWLVEIQVTAVLD